MSTAYSSTHLAFTDDYEILLNAPLDEIQEACANPHPFSQPYIDPVLSPTLPAFPSFDPDVHSANGVNYFPNYQGSSTMDPPAGSIPTMENPAPPMNHTYSQAASSFDLPVGNATNTAAVQPSEVISHQEVPFSFMFEYPFPAQPEVPPVQGQQQVQYQGQDAQGGFSALPEPVEVHNEGDQTYEESRASLVELEASLNNVSSNPSTPNTTVHTRFDDPESTSSTIGTIFLNLLDEFAATCPGMSAEDAMQLINAAMASSDSSAAASTSTPAHLSSSGYSPISPKQLEAALEPWESTRTDGSSTGTLQRSENNPEDGSETQQGEQSMDVQENVLEIGEASTTQEGGEKRRKKKKLVDGEYICLICKILDQQCPPLSRKDALKRHIVRMHQVFQVLLLPECDDFKILEPRQVDDETENLLPLAVYCIALQMEARTRGVEIKEKQDLMLIYPDVVNSLDLS